jgi:DNA-directed RNA polymerase
VTPNGFQAHRQIMPSEQAAESVSDAGAMPNLIHSLDGCVVQYTIEQWDGVLGVVHDAFFTTIDRAEELRDCVRAAYGRVYQDLGEFPVQWAAAPLPIGLCVGV